MKKNILCIIVWLILSSGVYAQNKPRKYITFEGAQYRWNSQKKQYIPYTSPIDRASKRQAQMMKRTPVYGQPMKIWDFWYSNP